ncbi:hypothetical protein CLAFUW4_14530 [Fulvia fulva]|uniref:Uncharacterized protein n=1 Tax=Passalora fulva TaxID=5499 RepID=A0A9Q8PMR0_PASFU|nr:uncharacterized protein CLAFUR5_14361 [Fulvia fulva]KAK4608920.1 hypothetical protein CLAFUR4_14525 [Fulvia fulva]KAK4609971.1 hypothetical protein CLAFUR0_14525 [Fulvia fulva]UJO25280.1 hypothetical protein CLAFUR5_14361 [Fulvia fulva]WPV22774.1 hypothetical protein CLAFUW4_14530 [Fulvia fulva]WPV37563.1 hypothetical protein CLAFUW7_14534 [Fulvia fulva]
MVRALISLAFGLLLCSSNAFASGYSKCSSAENTSLMKMIGNDPSIQRYCQYLPPSNRYDKSKCPKAIKNYSYDKVKSFCGCVKSKCMPTQCGYKNKCSKAPCGNYCADFKTDNIHCGKCGNKCKAGEECKSGSCKPLCPSGKPKQCPDPKKHGVLTCTDVKNDCSNCGKCGVKCKSAEKCQNGKCTPKAPQTPQCPSDKPDACPNPAKKNALVCTNKQKDNQNCAPIATLDSRRRGTAFRYQDSAGQSPSHPSARRPRASVEQLAAKQTKAAMSPLRHAVQQTQYLTAPFGDLSVARNAAQLERPAQMESANRAVGRLEAPVSDLKTVAATTVPFSGSRREVPHLGYVGRPPRLPPPTAPVKDQSAVPTAAPKEKPARMESANRAVAKKLPTVSRTQTVAATTASPPGSVLEGSSVQLGLVGPSLIAPVKDRCAPGGAAN